MTKTLPDSSSLVGGYATQITKDLADKVTGDVQAAIMRTALLADRPELMFPVIAAGQKAVVICVTALLSARFGAEISQQEARCVAIELLTTQLEIFAGRSCEEAHARFKARLAATPAARWAERVTAGTLK